MSSSSRSPISLDEPIDSRRNVKAVARQRQNRRERLLLLLAVVAVVLAWFYGYFTSGADVAPLVPKVIPGVASVAIQGDLFVGSDDAGQIIGYAAMSTAPGYGGPIDVLVGVDPTGVVLGVEIVAQRESPGFFRLVTSSDLVAEYTGRAVTDPLRLGDDLDAITGATVSAEGVTNAVRAAVRIVAAAALDTPLPPESTPIRFGAPEIVLILLFVTGYVGHRVRKPAIKKRIRWATLLGGLIFLGFIYTAPLTITMIASLLSGYWPDWHTNLYWYLLIGGILFVTTVESKNPYCSWFCPFGAFQECLAAVSGAKVYRPRTLSDALKWVQRGLALAAILLGLALRRPGVAGYEPFATLFDLRGSMVQWALLIIVVLASLGHVSPLLQLSLPDGPGDRRHRGHPTLDQGDVVNMARKTGEPLKQNLLLLFVVVCVALVGLTWVEGLREPQEKTPASSRGVPTAVGPTSEVSLPPSYMTKEHKNEDQHSTGTETATETATVTPSDMATPTPALATPTAPPTTLAPSEPTESP